MTTPAGGEASSAQSGRWQISLADLILLVLAVGVSAGIARQAREAWGNRQIPSPPVSPGSRPSAPSFSSPVNPARTAGVICEVAAVFLILNLAQTLIGLVRGWRGGNSGGAASLAWPCAWRIGAILILLAFVADLAGVLRIEYGRATELGAMRPGWQPRYAVSENLLPVCGALAIVGLALGMGAGVLFDDPPPVRHRPYWLFVPLAALIAALLAALNDYSIIEHLVLVALEAVSNAARYGRYYGPGLQARLLRSGVDAFVAFAASVALALVVARDFDRARRRLPWGTRRPGWIVRAVLSLCAIAASASVATKTIPRIHPRFAEGFVHILTPGAVVVMIGGFGLLALGMAARAVDTRPALAKPPWLRWLSACFRYGLLFVVFLTAMRALPSSTTMNSLVPASVGRAFDAVVRGQTWAWGLLPYPVLLVSNYCLQAEQLRWIVAAMFVAIVAVELTLTKAPTQSAPFDRAFASARSSIEIAWLTVGLTLVCLVALPPAVVLGQFFVNLQLNLEDWVKMGWPQ
jgi:hypothetical protein